MKTRPSARASGPTGGPTGRRRTGRRHGRDRRVDPPGPLPLRRAHRRRGDERSGPLRRRDPGPVRREGEARLEAAGRGRLAPRPSGARVRGRRGAGPPRRQPRSGALHRLGPRRDRRVSRAVPVTPGSGDRQELRALLRGRVRALGPPAEAGRPEPREPGHCLSRPSPQEDGQALGRGPPRARAPLAPRERAARGGRRREAPRRRVGGPRLAGSCSGRCGGSRSGSASRARG